MSTATETVFNPELFSRVRKFISAETPLELERYTGALYAHKVEYRCLTYSSKGGKDYADDDFRVDIVMNYRLADEPEILRALGLKQKDLYIYFDHS